MRRADRRGRDGGRLRLDDPQLRGGAARAGAASAAELTFKITNAPATTTLHYLRSTVLGGRTISEYNSSGARQTAYAWAGGEVGARQEGADTAAPRLRWEALNPVTGDGVESDAAGRVMAATRLDPSGVDVGEADPFGGAAGDPSVGDTSIARMVAKLMGGYFDLRCRIDGQLVGCAVTESLAAAGAVDACGEEGCGAATATVITTYVSGKKEHSLVSIPQGSLPGGFSETFTGASARAAAEQFEMALAKGEGGGAAVYWLLFAGRMMSGRPVDDLLMNFASQRIDESGIMPPASYNINRKRFASKVRYRRNMVRAMSQSATARRRYSSLSDALARFMRTPHHRLTPKWHIPQQSP